MKKLLSLLLVCALILTGCAPTISENFNSLSASTTATASEPLLALTIIKFPYGTFTARAAYSSSSPKTVAEWRDGEEEILINGGYFHEDYSPSGYLVVDGKRINKRIFDQDKSGLLVSENGKVTIRNLKTHPLQGGEQFDFAVQSFPFLIEDGQPAVKTISEKRARRTAVGVDQENNFYIISVDRKELSLYEFMQELLKTKISFVEVLNLDGGPSTGLYLKWNGEEKLSNSYFPVPSIIRFKKK